MPNSSIAVIIGHVGGDPLVSAVGSGHKIAKFSVAVSRKRKDKETTTWFRVSAWGRLADLAEAWVKKGRALQVSGELYGSEYTANDGTKRQSIEMEASSIAFLDSTGERSKDAAATEAAAVKVSAAGAGAGNDDEPPF